MKGRVIALDRLNHGGVAAALIVNGKLQDLVIDPPATSNHPEVGDIRVVKVKRKLLKSGAFCSIGAYGDGFLKDARTVREGDRLLAQVQSLPEAGKAVALTTRILIKGPRLILTPQAPGVNVSRRIGNATERDRLEHLVQGFLAEPDGTIALGDMGVIVRTAARNEGAQEIRSEFDFLLGTYAEQTALLGEKVPADGDNNRVSYPAALREWLIPRPDSILCAPDLVEELAHEEVGAGPRHFFGDQSFLTLIESEDDPLDATGVTDEIARIGSPEVLLDHSSMTIEPTRACISIDVNTKGDFSPAVGLNTNLAAANELPRQLRIRGLGGQIIVDFAPMPKQHRRKLEGALKSAFRHDPIDTALIGWTNMGLYEIQRKRERRPLLEVPGYVMPDLQESLR